MQYHVVHWNSTDVCHLSHWSLACLNALTLKMGWCSSEMSLDLQGTRHYIPDSTSVTASNLTYIFHGFAKSCQQYNKLGHDCLLPHRFQLITLIVLLFDPIQCEVLMPSLNIIQQLCKLRPFKLCITYKGVFVEDDHT